MCPGNIHPFFCQQPVTLALQLCELGRNLGKSKTVGLIPQLGEINTPQRVDAGEVCSLYNEYLVVILTWIKRVLEC
jgi:hypothetical protein